MAAVFITVDGPVAWIASPFAAKDTIRSAPGRKWNPERRQWSVPADVVDDLAGWLRDDGFDVTVRGRPARAQGRHPAEWTWALYDAVPEHLRDAAYRALLRVLHPDVGGDSRLAQQLNDTFRNGGRRTS